MSSIKDEGHKSILKSRMSINLCFLPASSDLLYQVEQRCFKKNFNKRSFGVSGHFVVEILQIIVKRTCFLIFAKDVPLQYGHSLTSRLRQFGI